MFVRIVRLMFCFLLFFSCLRAVAVDAAAPLDLFALHKNYRDQSRVSIEKESLSASSLTYYSTSYYLHGMISAIEATGDEALVNETLRYANNMLGKARDLNGDGHLEWGPLDVNGRPTQLYMFQSVSPIARLAAVIMNNSTLKNKHEASAQRYLGFVDDAIFKYWVDKVYRSKIPWGLCSPIWDDKCSHFATIAALMYRATGNGYYRKFAKPMAEAFKAKLQPYRTGWIWEDGKIPHGYGGNFAGVPDTSHANREPMMMVFMHEAGIVFTDQDMERLANTLSDTIWNGSTTSPLFSNYINGSNAAYRNRTTPGNNGLIYSGWALTGGFSGKAQQAVSSLMQAIVENRTNPSIAYNASSYGKVALSGHLLRNAALISSSSTSVSPKGTTR